MDLHTSVIHLLCLAVGPVFTWIYTPLSSHPPTVPCLAAWFTWIYASLLRIQLADLPTSRVHFHMDLYTFVIPSTVPCSGSRVHMDLHTSIISSTVPCLALQRGSHGSTHPYFVSSLPIDLHQYFDLHTATLASTVRCLVVPEVRLPCALHLTALKCNCFVLSTPIAISHHRS